jgi:hypothetical protein
MGSGFRDFATNEVLTSANVNNYLMTQAVMSFSSSTTRDSALSGSLEEGMVAYGRSENTYWWYDGSAWKVLLQPETSYTPTLSGTGWSIGNGVFTASYTQVGDTVHFSAVLSMGSTTSFGAGIVQFSLPVTATSPVFYTWFPGTAQEGTATQMYPLKWRLASSTAIQAYVSTAGGTYAQHASCTSSAPFTWASGHRLSVQGTYFA